MTAKQVNQLKFSRNYSKSEIKLKKLEMEANFWTKIDRELSNFPHKQFEVNRYADTDSILSRSLTAKEIYNTIYQPNEHLPHSSNEKYANYR